MRCSVIGCIVTLILSLLVTPLCSDAQQPGKLYRLAFLVVGKPPPSAPTPSRDAFRQTLRELGWVEGTNLAIEFHYAEGKFDRLADLTAAIVERKVDVIIAGGPAAQAAKQATSTIPIVRSGSGDAVAQGLVASLARPGGNVTGLTLLEAETDRKNKRIGKIKHIFSSVSRVSPGAGCMVGYATGPS